MEKRIPVVVIRDVNETDRVMKALCEYGIHTAEITFRTACAADAIRYAVQHFPEMSIGAGTVINVEQCRAALDAGAQFIVSPGLSAGVATMCRNLGVPYFPGCVTPTEIMQALDLGITTVKFFPANVYGGLKAMKALAAPFTQIQFIPTGGVNNDNIDEFLAWDRIAAVGGSFFVDDALRAYDAAHH